MNILQRVFVEPFDKCLENIITFLPNLLTSFFLLITGIVISVIFKIVAAKILKAVGLDKFAARFGFTDLFKRGGIDDSLSLLLAKLVGGLIFLVFVLLSMQALELMVVEKLLERFLLYLPNIVVAFLIMLAGYLLGNFFSRTALIAAVNAGMRLSRFIGLFVKLAIWTFAATMALEHVGIGRETVEITFALLFGGVVLALALAFGLGGRDLAKEYLAEKLGARKEPEKDELSHL